MTNHAAEPVAALGTGALGTGAPLTLVCLADQAAAEAVLATPAARFFVAAERDAANGIAAPPEALGGMQWVGSHPAAAAVWDLALYGLWYDAQLGHVVAAATATAEEVSRGDWWRHSSARAPATSASRPWSTP